MNDERTEFDDMDDLHEMDDTDAIGGQTPMSDGFGDEMGDAGAASAHGEAWTTTDAAVLEDGAPIEEVVVAVAEGALRVHGAGDGLRARGRADVAPRIARDGARVRVELAKGGVVEMPRGARLVLGDMPAAVSVRGVLGRIDGPRIDGDARVSDVGPVRLGAVGGGLTAEGVAGDLAVEGVGSGATVAGVRGDAALPAVGGALRLADVDGDVAATVGGAARIVVTPRPNGAYRVTAGGSIRWHAPAAMNAKVSASSGGRVRIDVPGAGATHGGSIGRYEAVLGEGGATVDLVAGGSVRISSGPGHESWDNAFEGEPLSDMAERIGVQVEGIAELISERIDETVGNLPELLAQRGLSVDQIERVAERLQHAGERAAEQVERRMRRMAEKAERFGERTERRAERLGHRERFGGAWPFAAPTPPEPPRAPAAPSVGASGGGADEVMAILRMVEGGKISAEEAERLIAALRGARA